MLSFKTILKLGLLPLALSAMAIDLHAETISLYAAGSLKDALTEVNKAYEASSGNKVDMTNGSSGLLRERIEKGEPAQVFASPDMGHPQKLSADGKGGPVRLFTRNKLCTIARSGLDVKPDTLLDVLLDPKVRVGTSTPKADPSGDYAFALFARAEKVRPGAQAKLEAKALQLVGGPTSAVPPNVRNSYAWHISENRADLFLGYCTSAISAKQEVPTLQIVDIPDNLAVAADYGLIVLNGAPAAAQALADFMSGEKGQVILKRFGFSPGEAQK